MRVSFRYADNFAAVQVDVPGHDVMTSVGLRSAVGWRWKCRLCGKLLRPNTAGAQTHIAMHVQQKAAAPQEAPKS